MKYNVEIVKGFSCPKKYLITIDAKPFLFFNCERQVGKAMTVLNGGGIESELDNLSKFVKSEFLKFKENLKEEYIIKEEFYSFDEDYYDMCKRTVEDMEAGKSFDDVSCDTNTCANCPLHNSQGYCNDRNNNENLLIVKEYIRRYEEHTKDR